MNSTEFVTKLALVALTFSDYPSNSDWLDPDAYVAACHALDDLFSVTYADAPAAHIVELMKYLTVRPSSSSFSPSLYANMSPPHRPPSAASPHTAPYPSTPTSPARQTPTT